jgi:hypothetical protein
MDVKREQIADIVLTAGIVAVSFATSHPVIAGIVGGIGVEFLGPIPKTCYNQIT